MNGIYQWQRKAWQRVVSALGSGRLPHAYLLRGPAGTAKREFAAALASLLLCERSVGSSEPCGECRSCVLASGGAHPDRHWLAVKEGKRDIPVDAIRDLVSQAMLTRSIAPFKPLVIADADAMSDSAANALLKTLEEPPDSTIFILVSSRHGTLLPTISSRCQRLDLPMPSPDEAIAWLSTMGVDDPEAARSVLEAAGGAPTVALELLSDDAALGQYEGLRKQLSDLMTGRASASEVAALWSKAPPESLFVWMLALGHGLIRRTLVPPEGTTPRAGLDVTRLYAILDDVMDARRAVASRANLNPTLLLESVALAWTGARGGQSMPPRQ